MNYLHRLMENTRLLKGAARERQLSNDPDIGGKAYIEFADLAVHDLDAPLRKLSVLIEMLTNKVPADGEAESFIERIKNCVGDMRSLIDDLSTWVTIDRVKLVAVPCDLAEIVRQALKNMPSALMDGQANIKISSLPMIEGDPNQFSHLFSILLANAIQYSRKNVASIINIQSSLLTSGEKDDLGLSDDLVYYKIVISDNGIGFHPENSEKIFHPLVRLHGKSQFTGNGIGLAICKKIVEVHRGIIYAEG